MMEQICSFCLEPSIIHCMNRSVVHKHSQQQQKSCKIIEALILNEEGPWCVRYKEAVLQSDIRQFLNYFMHRTELQRQYLQLLEYYKYRIFVPLFAKSKIADTTMSYYYDKLKLYYNRIKRQLNITIEQSSQSQFHTHTTHSKSMVSTPQEMLGPLRREIQEEREKNVGSIAAYKTQSKALEELVSYLKLNPRFDNIKTLKTEDCFEEQSIFEQTTHKKVSIKANSQESMRTSLKSRLFRKIFESTSQRKNVPVYETMKQRPKSKSKSKIVKLKESSELKQKIKYAKIMINKPVNASNSTKTLPVRNTSLNKINQNHYSSPYKHKAFSSQKGPATTVSSKNIRSKSIENIKVKNFDEANKMKALLPATQNLKFQTIVRSSPVSPSARKTPRPEIKVTQNDNILTIRKKKLEALKEKVGRR